MLPRTYPFAPATAVAITPSSEARIPSVNANANGNARLPAPSNLRAFVAGKYSAIIQGA